MDTRIKKILSQVAIILFFVIISFAYFYPTIQGKVLRQMDLEHAVATGNEANTAKLAENRNITWTNSLFGGMPTYQISGIKKKNIFSTILRTINHTLLPYGTVSSFFVYLLGFYILLLSFKTNKWLSALGAIAYALSSYNIIIIAAGHITKTYAIGLMPIAIAGTIMLYDKKYWLGIITFLLGFGLQITTNHIQIVYYTILIIGVYAIFRFIWDLKEKKLAQFFKSSAIALGLALLIILPSLPNLWQAWEISKYSIRGKSELSANKNQGSGLDKDYALAWSYGPAESFTLFIPNFKGGATGYIGENDVAMDVVTNQYKDYIKQQNQYWGNQPFTSGPVYFGAIIFFLAVLAMFIVKDKIKWWLLAVTVLSLILSWGKHAGFVTDIFFDYFPFYNKFRTVSMILTIAGFSVPMLAFLGLRDIIEDKQKLKKNLKFLWISLGLTAGTAFIFWLIPNIFNFLSGEEQKYFAELIRQAPDQKTQINAFLEQLKNARISIFKADAIRSVLYIIVGAGSLFLFTTMKNFKKLTFIAILGVFILLDMWTVDRRYLKGDDFVKNSKAKAIFTKTFADTFVLKDKDPYYRVLNLTRSPFNDALTSYYHKSIGGYHGAKLRRYQDVIEKYLAPYSQAIVQGLQDSTINIYDYLGQMSVLNMLNTKYIIHNSNVLPIINAKSYGNAWFVDNFKIVNSADEEINALGTENLERTAIINAKKSDIKKLPEQNLSEDLNRSITLSVYKPDQLVFEINSTKGGFIVFSDIYYPVGWHATIDGKETNIFQTNYILRGIVVPAGKHIVKFEFKPNAVFLANNIAFVGSIFVILLLLFSGYMIYKNNSVSKEATKKIKKQ